MGINVLSLFDGMSCGQIALERVGIAVDNYFASEIKPHAIKVTQHNYPKTIQLGDVTKITKAMLPKIDMVIGGSPCQDFSRGNKERKGLEGLKSRLFMEYLRLVQELSPAYFLLENVVMDFMDEMALSGYMGVRPVRINSSLVSAALRDRLYWTNIGPYEMDLFGNKYSTIPPPTDKGIKLKDILDSGYVEFNKHSCLNTGGGRSLTTPSKMWHRYQTTGMTTLIFTDPKLNWEKGIRYCNVKEMEIMQTIPLGYCSILKDKEAADCMGDGWTVDVIAHIFSFLPKEYKL